MVPSKLPPPGPKSEPVIPKPVKPSPVPIKLLGSSGIKLKLGGLSKPAAPLAAPVKTAAVFNKPKLSAAAVFNDDDSDEEEIPAEARMKMRNVGRDTITSSGPNSFGKTAKGFTDCNRLFEKNLQEAMDKVSNDNVKPK